MIHELDFTGWENEVPWCVPTAVSLLTGVPVGYMHSRAAFIQNKPRKEVKGVYTEEALLLLREQGFKASPIEMTKQYKTAPTIKKFLENRTNYEKAMPIMFGTHDHMMVCHFNYAADNWTKKPVSIEKFPKLHRRVTEAWIVQKC